MIIMWWYENEVLLGVEEHYYNNLFNFSKKDILFNKTLLITTTALREKGSILVIKLKGNSHFVDLKLLIATFRVSQINFISFIRGVCVCVCLWKTLHKPVRFIVV